MITSILGVKMNFDISMSETINKIDKTISEGEGSYIISTTNPFFIMSAQKDPEFMNIINSSLLSLPDGIGTLYAKKYLEKVEPIKEKPFFPFRAFYTGISVGILGLLKILKIGDAITGVDLTYKMLELANKKKYTVLFLGGSVRDRRGKIIDIPGYDMASHAVEILKDKYSNIRFIGATSQFSREPSDDEKTLSYIHECMRKNNINHIDMVFVAYNPVGQEKWIWRNMNIIPAKISVGIGRTFDYITETMRPPNKIWEKLHLAWLYVLLSQPWRYKRVFMTFPLFPLKVFIKSIK